MRSPSYYSLTWSLSSWLPISLGALVLTSTCSSAVRSIHSVRTSPPMLPPFCHCWSSSGLQCFILWWVVVSTFQVPGNNIYIIFNLCLCKCSKLTVCTLFWEAFLSIALIQNMEFLGILVDLWESFGHFTWSSRYLSYPSFPSLHHLHFLSPVQLMEEVFGILFSFLWSSLSHIYY